jgi:hypothetical protein
MLYSVKSELESELEVKEMRKVADELKEDLEVEELRKATSELEDQVQAAIRPPAAPEQDESAAELESVEIEAPKTEKGIRTEEPV